MIKRGRLTLTLTNRLKKKFLIHKIYWNSNNNENGNSNNNENGNCALWCNGLFSKTSNCINLICLHSVVFPPQPATATFTPEGVVSTWSSTNCRGGRAEESASTVATTRQVATATIARRATTETCRSPSHTEKPAKVQGSVCLLFCKWPGLGLIHFAQESLGFHTAYTEHTSQC